MRLDTNCDFDTGILCYGIQMGSKKKGVLQNTVLVVLKEKVWKKLLQQSDTAFLPRLKGNVQAQQVRRQFMISGIFKTDH